MSNSYNTDGLFTWPIPKDGEPPITQNAFESIECAIAFDVRDWSADRRSAWIYAIVFGWDYGESWDEMASEYGWDEADRKRAQDMHEQWEKAKAAIEPIKPTFLQDHKFGCTCGAVVGLGNPYCWSCGKPLAWG